MNKTIIISGGAIHEAFAKKVIEEHKEACIIGVDHGIDFLYENQILPQYIVGDFDSANADVIEYYRKETKVPIREFNPIKDASDTEMALRLAITLGSSEIIILGATGDRLDHFWANVQTLAIACHAGVKAYILDSKNKIQVIDKGCTLKKSEAFGPYLSVFTLNGDIFDFNMRGTKWPLIHHTLKASDSYTVSNEFKEDEIRIDFMDGLLVVMQTRDK